jgi:hypothetical protein
MLLLGAGAVAIGLLLFLFEWGYAGLGGILIVVGILLHLTTRRVTFPLRRND